MKKTAKKALAGVIIGALSVSMFAGCGQKIDGTKAAGTVNGEEVSLGVVSLLARYQQAKMGGMFGGMMGFDSNTFWDQVADEETGETQGQATVREAAEQIQQMYVIRTKAPEYQVELTEEDQQKITESAQAFLEANEPEVLEKIGASQEDVELFLELTAYQMKVQEEIQKGVDTEVSDEEAQQTTITYSKVAYGEEDTEEEKEEKKGQAQEILDEVMATADADMKAIAEGISEDSTTINIHYSVNDPEDDTVDQALKDGVAGLADGEVNSSLIDGGDGYYVVRLDKTFDEEATEIEKENIITERENELYETTTKGWFEEAEMELDEKVLGEIEVSSKNLFTEKQTGTTPEEEAPAAETEAETETETEAETETETEAETEAESGTETEASEATEAPAE